MDTAKKSRRTVTAVWFAGFLLIWEAAAFAMQNVFRIPSAGSRLPYLHTVVITVAQNWRSLLTDCLITLSRAGIGFAIGSLVGVALALLMSLSKTVEKIAFPYLIISQMIPVLGLAPIIFNIVRDMNASRIVIAAYITFFPVSVNMLSGLKSVGQDRKDLLYSVAAGRFGVYCKLMIPASLTYLFTGLKITAPMAVTASILVDMLGSSSGIGVRILYSLYSSNTDVFWAAVAASAVMGIASYYLVVFVEKLALPWQKNGPAAPEGVGA